MLWITNEHFILKLLITIRHILRTLHIQLHHNVSVNFCCFSRKITDVLLFLWYFCESNRPVIKSLPSWKASKMEMPSMSWGHHVEGLSPCWLTPVQSMNLQAIWAHQISSLVYQGPWKWISGVIYHTARPWGEIWQVFLSVSSVMCVPAQILLCHRWHHILQGWF